MNKFFYTLALGTTILMIASCGGAKKSEYSKEQITSTVWQLKSLNGVENPAYTLDGESFTLQFDTLENRIGGMGACNRYMGEYNFSEEQNKIDLIMGGATRMLCPNEELEQPFFTALNDIDTYYTNDGDLVLAKGEETIIVLTAKVNE